MKIDPHATNGISTQCSSNVIINDEYPHGMSVLKEDDQFPSSMVIKKTKINYINKNEQ